MFQSSSNEKKYRTYARTCRPCLWLFVLFVMNFVFLCYEYRYLVKFKCFLHRLYLQLFVGRLMSYLRYLCFFAYWVVQHILCCVFIFLSSSSVPFVDSVSGLSIYDMSYLSQLAMVSCSLEYRKTILRSNDSATYALYLLWEINLIFLLCQNKC
jgi:hypothetical protein